MGAARSTAMSMLLAQGLHSAVQATPSPRGPSRLGATTYFRRSSRLWPRPPVVETATRSARVPPHFSTKPRGPPTGPGHALMSPRGNAPWVLITGRAQRESGYVVVSDQIIRHNDTNQLHAMIKRPSPETYPQMPDMLPRYAMKQGPNARGQIDHRAARQRAPTHAMPGSPALPLVARLIKQIKNSYKRESCRAPTTPRLPYPTPSCHPEPTQTPDLSLPPRLSLPRARPLPSPPPRLGYPTNWPGHRMSRPARNCIALQSSAGASKKSTPCADCRRLRNSWRE